MSDEERKCTNCVSCWADGSGYSDWTWMNTELQCFRGINPLFPVDEGEPGGALAVAVAEKCEFFEIIFDDDGVPTVSPDGELGSTGHRRLAALLRGLSK